MRGPALQVPATHSKRTQMLIILSFARRRWDVGVVLVIKAKGESPDHQEHAEALVEEEGPTSRYLFHQVAVGLLWLCMSLVLNWF